MNRKKKILVAPLDWGLGHATRCIPVINELLKQNAEVIIASDGRAFDLLKQEFPQLRIIRLKGYRIVYHKNLSLPVSMFIQLPKIIRTIRSERSELKRIINEYEIDAVISDNRYGLYSNKIPSVFVTHQLRILMPSSLKWMEGIVYRINKYFIGKYTEYWVPDNEGEINLSGKLSHFQSLPENIRFAGILSRCVTKENTQKKYDVLAVCSGPEPQRTVFENLLTKQLKQLQLKSLIISGTPEESVTKEITPYLSVTSFMNTDELNNAVCSSDIIIARSGYSTIMDLAVLGKKAILIPTPGQTEQEYLADYFKEKRIFYSESQRSFNIERALEQSKKYLGIKLPGQQSLSRCVSGLLERIK